MEWISETYPNLIGATFLYLDQLNHKMLNAFYVLNPQLQTFCLRGCKQLTSSIFQEIATQVPSLVDLEFHMSVKRDEMTKLQHQFEKDVMHLSGLRYLRRLHGKAWHKMSTCSIVDDLANNNVPIEDLHIDGINPHIVKSVAKLTNMRKLSLNDFRYGLVVDLIMKLPVLQDLQVFGCTPASLNGVKRILEQATNLKTLTIDSNDMLIDSDHLIHSILDLIRGRVQVKINVRSRNVHIPLGPYVCQSADYFWLELHSN